MRPATPFLVLLGICSSLLIGRPAAALWPQTGTPVCTQSDAQFEYDLAPDGNGGAFIVWTDYRPAPGFPNVFIQHVDGWGTPLWATDGIPLTTSAGNESYPRIVADGSGGAIAVWHDSRNIGTTQQDIYAQRVDALGNLLWGASGLAVCTQPGNQVYVAVAPDGVGGVLATWLHDTAGSYTVTAQRVSAGGTVLWNPAGVAASAMGTSGTDRQRVIGDGLGGAITCWHAVSGGSYNVYAQHVTAAGNAVWNAGGTPVCAAVNDQTEPNLATDGAGGALVVWQDYRNFVGTFTDIYAQRMYANGSAAWTLDGVPVCTQGDFQFPPTIAADKTGGAIIAWGDYRNSMGQDQYAQRVGANGAMLWAPNGIAISIAPHDQASQQMVADGAGGAVIAWQDLRDGSVHDIYAQRVNGSGVVQWTADGLVVCNAVDGQNSPQLVSDGLGGAVIAWGDVRNSSDDIYAQRVERNGYWGFPSPEIVSARDAPGDQGHVVNVAWDASRLDPWPDQLIESYTVWRAIDATAAAAVEARGGESVRHGVDAVPTGGEVVRVQELNSTSYYWQLMATVNAYSLPGYAQTVATLFDSTSASPEPHYFQVLAHSGSQYWASAPASGRSVDNLAPAAPLTLTAQRVGFDVDLVWRRSAEADLDHYAIYRATAAGVQPIPIHFIDNSTDTVYTDVSPPTGYLYYVVAAWDVHENQSPPSNEAAVTIPTGVGDGTPPLTRLSLDTNVPNPFSDATELRVGLPRAGGVAVDVYDVAGRRVFARRYGQVAAGWNRIAFEARGTDGALLPSGVYFYRVTTGTETLTRKMVIQR